MPFKIATWNVNSLRVRLPHVLDWIEKEKPDVFALQEIKLVDADFPADAIRAAGYEIYCSGQKAYNGVAILARRQGHEIIKDLPGLMDPQRRVLAITVDDVRIINLYVPNGESLTSEKYRYKLNWLEYLKLYLAEERKKYSKIIILGDFNIAPEDIDVHDPEAWRDQVLCSEPERLALQNIINLDFQDCFRIHTQPEKSFTWWDYRLNAFKRNLGARIDHIIASSSFASVCSSCHIDKSLRALERPSDHTVVVAEFNHV